MPAPVTTPANETSKTSAKTSPQTSAIANVRPRLKVPQQVAPGTVVWVGGDASLIRLSELLRYEFKRRFPGTEVDVRTANTETALANVLDGSLDVAAISRPLTPAEEAQGLIAVPLARHKIAVLIGPNNPFEGSLTNLQLAQILRGEITRWSQVGGQDSPLRLVDRAANSATRQALIRYPMFAGVDKTTVAPPGRGDRLSDIAATLGVDGITYALIDQVSDDIVNPDQVSRGDVKIVPLHQVMPDDPRYSISQPMVYVYRGPKPSAKAEAFMAYATVLRGRGLLADGASLNARGTWLDNWAVRGLLLLAGGTILVSAIADLRKDNLKRAHLRSTLLDNPRGNAPASHENPQSPALGNLELGNPELGNLEFYDERTSTHLLLSLEDRDFASSPVSSHLPESRTLWARWMVADQQRASLPIEQGGGLEVRLYEYQAQEAIPTETLGSAQLGSVARRRPFLAYPCDGPEGILALHPRNCALARAMSQSWAIWQLTIVGQQLQSQPLCVFQFNSRQCFADSWRGRSGRDDHHRSDDSRP
ncbi:MAG: hypothetical protein HC857_04460 [Synechococcales cyanobacterium RU_4_20]|nr:hypothetical protein [Synechococcales cyanobacterium RU_4_20]